MIEVIGWTATALALSAFILNILKHKICFILWITSNILFIWYSIQKTAYAQLPMWGIYFILNIIGYIKWSKAEKKEKKK